MAHEKRLDPSSLYSGDGVLASVRWVILGDFREDGCSLVSMVY